MTYQVGQPPRPTLRELIMQAWASLPCWAVHPIARLRRRLYGKGESA